MPWLQVSVSASQAQAPLLELLLENLGAVSVTLGDAADEPILEPNPGEQRLWSRTRVTALFPGEIDSAALSSNLQQVLPPEIIPSLALERIEDRVWERAWMDDFRPMRFGGRLWVCPSGMQVSAANAVVLDLDPGLAFGTGTHPTTALCLEWLDGAALAGRRVIDYGCGSGILAIGALLLGAAEVAAVDHDPQALQATRENAQRNGVADRLRVYAPGQVPKSPVDILLANILAAPLIELCPLLTALVKPGGSIVLSGILNEQEEVIRSAYRARFELESPARKDEWVRINGTRRRRPGQRD